MLKEYRFEKFVDKVTSADCHLIDTKTYYKLNEHWINAVVYRLLYDRAIAKGYRCITNNTKHHVYEKCKYYKAEEFEYEIVLSKERT